MSLPTVQTKAGTDETGIVCVGSVRVCVCVYQGCKVPLEGCVYMCTFQLCAFGFEVAAPCQPAFSALQASCSPACVPEGEAGKTCGGGTWRSRRETQPTCCLPAVDNTQCRASAQNMIPSVFVLARLCVFVKRCSVDMSCDIFNL